MEDGSWRFLLFPLLLEVGGIPRSFKSPSQGDGEPGVSGEGVSGDQSVFANHPIQRRAEASTALRREPAAWPRTRFSASSPAGPATRDRTPNLWSPAPSSVNWDEH